MEKVAIIGTGIAGMGCGHLLHKKYDLTFYEQNDYVGGHTSTISVTENDKPVFMDTGFMVFNFETYPQLTNLFKEIGAPVKKTDMSFSVQYKPTGLEYCGSGVNGLFAQRKNLFSARYIKMLMEISRFNTIGVKILDDARYAKYSLTEFVSEFHFSDDMLWQYLIPMSSAVWSTPPDKMLEFPAVTLIRFFKNHGFLGLNTQHQWYTLHNGSWSYRDILVEPFKDRIHTNKGATKVTKKDNFVRVELADGTSDEFDKVIVATHADQALKLLAEPEANETRLLSAFRYQKNSATVHCDESVMPKNKRTWSSWNYSIEKINDAALPTTIYWMNKLQGVSEKKNYFVSINALPGSILKEKVIREIEYEHPLFDVTAIEAQKELHLLNKKGPLYFCGSYFKYGFHEDAFNSAVELCKDL
jgi:uncharacterized protein